MSEADDVRLTAQLVVAKRVHCISDTAVEALARRVLELESVLEVVREVGEASKEREACAKVCDDFGWDERRTREGTTDWVCRRLAEAIRARGRK